MYIFYCIQKKYLLNLIYVIIIPISFEITFDKPRIVWEALNKCT